MESVSPELPVARLAGIERDIRVLKWILERIERKADARPSPVGHLPTQDSLDLSGLEVDPAALTELLSVDRDEWLREAESIASYYQIFGDRLPPELSQELTDLQHRLQS